jgi:hypothetical protein
MAIPSSPSEVSLGQLRVEFVNTATNDYALRRVGGPTSSGFAGATDPPQFTPVNQNSTYKPDMVAEYAMSEWYRYDHSEYGQCSILTFTTPNIGRFFTYYKIEVTGEENAKVRVMVTPLGPSNIFTYINIYRFYPFNTDGSLVSDAPALSLQTSGSYVDAVYSKPGVDNDYFHVVIFDTSAEIYTMVFINICVDPYTDPNGGLNVRLRATTLPGYYGGQSVNLLESVNIGISITSINGIFTDSVIFPQGTDSITVGLTNFIPDMIIINALIYNIDPKIYSTQKYSAGQVVVGIC